MSSREYVCPQCGLDPRGRVYYDEYMHTIGPDHIDEILEIKQAALLATVGEDEYEPPYSVSDGDPGVDYGRIQGRNAEKARMRKEIMKIMGGESE